MTFRHRDTSLSRYPFVCEPNIGRMPLTALARYATALDAHLYDIELQLAELGGNLDGCRPALKVDKWLTRIGIAALIGGFTAPVDGGALFWLIASGSLTQIGWLRTRDTKRRIDEIDDAVAMLELNHEIISGEIAAVNRRRGR